MTLLAGTDHVSDGDGRICHLQETLLLGVRFNVDLLLNLSVENVYEYDEWPSVCNQSSCDGGDVHVCLEHPIARSLNSCEIRGILLSLQVNSGELSICH